MTRILVAENDDAVAHVVASELAADGYEVERVACGANALDAVGAMPLDLIILDVLLPGCDGFRVLRTIRDAGNETPVLVLTARRSREDKVRAFRLGADDYVTKPFDALELVARVGALIRRTRRCRSAVDAGDAPAPLATSVLTSAPHEPIVDGDAAAPRADPARVDQPPLVVHFSDVEVNRATRVVRRSGTPVSLFPKEYELLIALIDRGGAIATRAELRRELWGPRAVVSTRAIDTHVAALRRRLEAVASAPQHILTVRKVGYRFDS